MRTLLAGSPARPATPRGFTLVELLVVISIIGTLVALLLPAVGAARATARKTECSNALRQLATAMINYQTSKQRLPGYVQPVKRSNGEYVGIDTSGGLANSQMVGVGPTPADKLNSWISWAAVIAPEMERQDLWDLLVDKDVTTGDPRARVVVMESLICPDDTDLRSSPANAGLTYSVNAGAWDYDGVVLPSAFLKGAGIGDTKDNGLCHNLTLGGPTFTGQVTDGSSTTLLLAENIHKEVEADPYYSWMGVAPDALGEAQLGLVWVVNTQPATGSGRTFQQPFSFDPGVAGYRIDLPDFARPASAHAAGAFNAAMADGSVRSIAASIDYTVYQRLMTPRGRDCVDPMDHNDLSVVDGPDGFRKLPPLADGDY